MPFTGKPQYPSRPGTCPDHLLIDKNHHLAKPDNKPRRLELDGTMETLANLAVELGCTTRILGVIVKHAGVVVVRNERFRVAEVKAAFAEFYPGEEAMTSNMLADVIGARASTITALNFQGFLKPCAVLAGVKLYTADDYYEARERYDKEREAELAARKAAEKHELAEASKRNKAKGPPKNVRYRRPRSPWGIDG